MNEKAWTIDVVIDEHGDRTRAKARLRNPQDSDLVGIGTARLNPDDTNVPEIGDELALSRALSDLAHKLLDAAAEDIEETTHQAVRLTH